MIPAFPNILDVISDKVKNVDKHPIASLNNLKIQTTCWLET